VFGLEKTHPHDGGERPRRTRGLLRKKKKNIAFLNHPQFDLVPKKSANRKFPQFCNESVQKICMDFGMEMDVKLNIPV
jgi:hypothetical protein